MLINLLQKSNLSVTGGKKPNTPMIVQLYKPSLLLVTFLIAIYLHVLIIIAAVYQESDIIFYEIEESDDYLLKNIIMALLCVQACIS